MKNSTLQSRQITIYLVVLGLFTLSVLAMASYRGVVAAELNEDAERVGALRANVLLVYISESNPVRPAIPGKDILNTMGEQINLLLSRYPQQSDEFIQEWKNFYKNANQRQLTRDNTQRIEEIAKRFSAEIRNRAHTETRNGYWMSLYSALGLILLLTRGFILVRSLEQAEIALKDSEQRFSILAEASLDGIAISDNGIIIDANAQLSKLLGYEPSEVIGRHLTDFAIEEDVERSKDNIQHNREISYEVTCIRKDKTTFPVEITARMLEFSNRKMRLTVARDITERKRLEGEWREANKNLAISNERWRTLATLDSLTGAYTRRALHLTMIREIRRSNHSGLPFSIIMLDIDGFKQYNDAFGHMEGDYVLRRVVEILREHLRDVDVVARYGGDEFVLVLVDTGALETNAVARRCYSAIKQEDSFRRKLTASLGVVTCFIEAETSLTKEQCTKLAQEILLLADKSLYQSKTKELEHITFADNLRVNKDFVITKLSESTQLAESNQNINNYVTRDSSNDIVL